jgi:ribonuclease J
VRVRIHRGARQVGGSCVEVEHAGERVVIDAGLPLEVGVSSSAVTPAIAGFATRDDSLLGLVISHSHPDHCGLVAGRASGLPVFMSEPAAAILRQAEFFVPGQDAIGPTRPMRDREPFQLGPFRIAPYLMDHSAFDAFALLLEAGNRRLLYSGDVRAHGRKQSFE